jgi:hypothetical protein
MWTAGMWNKVVLFIKIAYNYIITTIDNTTIMDKVKQLGLQMEQQMKSTLTLNPKDGFWYDNDDLDIYYTEEGIRLAVYEDLKDTLNHLYSDCAY